MDSKHMIIALDGPAGSGKSTVAKILSQKLDIEYIDSGAIYRTLTLFGMQQFAGECQGHEDEIAGFFEKFPEQLELVYENHSQRMRLQGVDVSAEIRTLEVTRQIKFIASHPRCRELVNAIIRRTGNAYDIVVDGRDIGTVVFPQTPYKFYLDAAPEERARRRALDLEIAVAGEEFQQLLAEIKKRDQEDMNRDIAPLKKADDALAIATENYDAAGVAQLIFEQIKAR